MAAIASEGTWGMAFMLIALIKGYAATWEKRGILSTTFFISFFMWLMVAVGLILPNWQTTATAIYPWFVLVNALGWWYYKQ